MSTPRRPPRMQAVFKLMKKYEQEPSHARQVQKIALRLFDELKELHGLSAFQREFLQAAALLHDIGWSQGVKGHHKSSLKLILSHKLAGWTDNERLIVANIARYHRKALPDDRHTHFCKLAPEEKLTVNKLSSLLRVADSLDRSHMNSVDDIQCTITTRRVKLELSGNGTFDAEMSGFKKKRDLFEQIFKRDVVLAKKTKTAAV